MKAQSILTRVMGGVLVALMMAFASAGTAWADAFFTNEPAGSQAYFDCAFSDSLCGMANRYNTQAYASPGGSGTMRSGPRALDEYMLTGASQGNGQWGLDFPKKMEIFVGFVWRSTAYGYPNNNNKLIFIKDPSNSFLVWQGSAGTGSKQLKWYQQEEIDNCHNSYYLGYTTGYCWNATNPAFRDGTGWWNPNVNGSVANVAPNGPWTKVEIYLKASTCKTCANGIVRIWVNGTLSSNFTDVNQGWNRNAAPNVGFGNVEITSTWDGQYAATVDWHHYFDHLRVSFPNCVTGCVVTEEPPPVTPPPPPTGSGNYPFSTQFSGTQGASQWSYRDEANNLLTYDAVANIWRGGEQYAGIWSNGIHPGTSSGTKLRWTAPSNGTARVTGSVKDYDTSAGDGQQFYVKYGPSVLKFAKDFNGSDTGTYAYDFTQSMVTGEYIEFIVTPRANNNHDSTMLNPVIDFTPTGAGGVGSPTVSGFTPTSGDRDVVVTISGTNFAPTIAGNVVKFNGTVATCTGASTTALTCLVPQGATAGTISVTTSIGTGVSSGTFTPTSAANRTVSISWSYSGKDVNGNKEQLDHFEILRSPTLAGTYNQIGTAAKELRTYTDVDAPLSKAYYKVRAVDTSSNVSSASTAQAVYDAGVSVDADSTAPEAPYAVSGSYR